jgi:hypothetical protein
MKLFYRLANQVLFILFVAFIFSCQSNNKNSNFPSKIEKDSIEFRVEKQTTSDIINRDYPELIDQFEKNLEKIILDSINGPILQKLKSNLVNDKMTPQQFVDYMKHNYRKTVNADAVIIWKNMLKKNKNLDSIKNTNK